jgi:alkylation response protein AidB-like acyl-CoA dehydrogenase
MMPSLFQPTPEQQALCEAIRTFGASLNEGMIERDAQAAFDRERWRRCGEAGIPGLPVPTAYGGSGRDVVTSMLAMTAFGRACRDNGLAFALGAQMWSVELPLVTFGSEEQKRRYLPGLSRGEMIAAHAVTEPESGSDAMSMTTRAVRDGEHYVLNGVKTLITNAPVADFVLLFGTVNPTLRAAGVTGFLVDRGTPGLELSAPIPKMGLRTAQMGRVVLRDCRVPVSGRLGREGAGLHIFNAAMEWERICVFACHLGAMERLLEDTIAYAKKRKQFGERISRHPPVAEKIVNMKVAVEAGKLLLYHAAAVKDASGNAILDASVAKLFISEAHVRQALDAVQIFGGYGYLTENEVERELRDAIPGTLYSGTSEMQRKIIARLLDL